MQSGFYQTAGAMVTQFNILDITSNNLANINTSGFKKDGVVIGEFEKILQKQRDELPLENGSDKAAKFLNRSINKVPRIVQKYIDFSTSNIKYTGNDLDIALRDDDTFFAVRTPNGVKLTQTSSFKLDKDGNIVTSEGYQLMPDNFITSENISIPIPSNATIKIADDGTIYANGVDVGKIFIGKVQNLDKVKKIGNNLYDVENMQENLVSINGSRLVSQGYMKMSNVNAIKEMISLIQSNRMVEIYQKVMTSHMSDLNQDAITKLASTKG